MTWASVAEGTGCNSSHRFLMLYPIYGWNKAVPYHSVYCWLVIVDAADIIAMSFQK